MHRNIFYLALLCLYFISCEEEYSQTKRLNIITGRIIDSPKTTNFSDYKLTARSIFGTNEKDIASTQLSDDGTFRMEYYSDGNYTGNNLRLTFSPTIPRSYKFDFLPYGINWTKTFYLSDSAKIVFKNKYNFNNADTITLFTNPRTYSFIVSKNNNYIGEVRIVNVNGNMIHKINSMPDQSIYINPTGDPIVDTITLDINP